jgi:dolichyl-phosphate-mannose-protein mannosyltransferase
MSQSWAPSARDWRIALLALVVAAAFRLPGLAYPTEEYFDEVYHAKTAWQYLHGEPPVEWVHPPTAKLLIAVGVWAFGYEPWAWRLAPAIAGMLLAPVFFLFARRVLPTERAALLATALLLADGVYLVQSRIAMTNIFAVLFQVTAAYALVRSVLEERLRFPGLSMAGIFLGLALSTRWTSLWTWGFLGLVLLVVRRRRILTLREILLTLLAFLVLPVSIYVLSYVPWMWQGHTLLDFSWRPPFIRAGEVVTLQRDIWSYHANLKAKHPYFSEWWTWPWLYRPTWYFFKNEGGWTRGIFAIGNPALWWATVPVTVWALVTGFRQRDKRLLFSGTGFCLMYLPWGISPRTLNYGHYLFEAIPYACLSLGTLLDRHWQRPVARIYVGMVVFLFVLFLPLFLALPIPPTWFGARLLGGPGIWTWFRSWI